MTKTRSIPFSPGSPEDRAEIAFVKANNKGKLEKRKKVLGHMARGTTSDPYPGFYSKPR